MNIRKTGSDAEARECAGIMASSEPWITLRRGFEESLKLLRDPGKEVYAALEEQEVIGFIILDMRGPFAGYIQTIAVREDRRNRGVGRALIAFAENRIFTESPNVFICVSSFNEQARKLYEHLGFEEIGILKDYVVAGHSEILMRKTVAPMDGYLRKDSPAR